MEEGGADYIGEVMKLYIELMSGILEMALSISVNGP